MRIMVDFPRSSSGPTEAEVADGGTVLDLLKSLSLHPDAHIAMRDGKPVPMDDTLEPGCTVRLLSVVSGG